MAESAKPLELESAERLEHESAKPLELEVLHSTPNSTSNTASADQEKPQSTQPVQPNLRLSHGIIVIIQLTAVTFFTSITTGLITVSIPTVAADLSIQPQLYYW